MLIHIWSHLNGVGWHQCIDRCSLNEQFFFFHIRILGTGKSLTEFPFKRTIFCTFRLSVCAAGWGAPADCVTVFELQQQWQWQWHQRIYFHRFCMNCQCQWLLRYFSRSTHPPTPQSIWPLASSSSNGFKSGCKVFWYRSHLKQLHTVAQHNCVICETVTNGWYAISPTKRLLEDVENRFVVCAESIRRKLRLIRIESFFDDCQNGNVSFDSLTCRRATVDRRWMHARVSWIVTSRSFGSATTATDDNVMCPTHSPLHNVSNEITSRFCLSINKRLQWNH